MARRHVEAGWELIAHQEELIAKLRAAGHPSQSAERLLETFESIQQSHIEHLAYLMRAA